MSEHPVTLTDQHRTVVLHVFEVAPAQFSWCLVLEETCGSADCDCTIEGHMRYATRIEAEAAAWAEGNRLLNGTRTASECNNA